MAKSYLEKYYEDNNPVNERINIVPKMAIRVIVLAISSLVFIVLRILNHYNIFNDLSSGLLLLIYVVMGLSILISFISLIIFIISLISKEAFHNLLNLISFDKKKLIFTILDWMLVVPICICIAIFLYGYVCRIQMVSGPSMEPSFYNGERIISIYDMDNLKRGDVVICAIYEEDYVTETEDIHIIKRVIGLPGDTVKYELGKLYLNGKEVYEDYVSKSTGISFNGNFFTYNDEIRTELGTVIPEGYVFVMGDNRGDSKDSRQLGLIPIEKVYGVVIAKIDGLKFEKVERGVLSK